MPLALQQVLTTRDLRLFLMPGGGVMAPQYWWLGGSLQRLTLRPDKPTRIIVKEYLPMSTFLIDHTDGISLSVLSGAIKSDPSEYRGVCILSLPDCRVIKRWIPECIGAIRKDVPLEMWALLECDNAVLYPTQMREALVQ